MTSRCHPACHLLTEVQVLVTDVAPSLQTKVLWPRMLLPVALFPGPTRKHEPQLGLLRAPGVLFWTCEGKYHSHTNFPLELGSSGLQNKGNDTHFIVP
jgi:hypothetical protein